MIVIPMKENIINIEVFISVTISSFNTTTVTEVVKMCRIRLQLNMSKERLAVPQYRIAILPEGWALCKSKSDKR